MNKIIIILICFVSGILGFTVSWVQHQNDNMTPPSASNTPTIQVTETYHYPTTFVKQLAGDPEAGKKVFKEYCVSCHGEPPLIDVDAPHIGDVVAWQKLRKSGMARLLKITNTGKGAMPARGGCFECSDAQLFETVQYILNNSTNSSSSQH